MKTQQQSAARKQHNWQRPGIRRGTSLSLYQRIARSWVINALVVPILITLLSAAITLLLMHWGK
jgi:hypothetical protein